MKFLTRVILGVSLCAAQAAFAVEKPAIKSEEIKSLEQRIEQLEAQQAEVFLQLNRDKNVVQPFLRSKILLGGFFETSFTHMDGPNMDSQIEAGPHIMGLNIAAEFSDRDKFVAQLQSGLGYSFLNRHNDPRWAAAPHRKFSVATASTLLIHAYYEHTFSEGLKVQSGLGYVPFGIGFRLREPLLLKRRGGESQMVTQSVSGNGGATNVGIAFPLWMGVHAHGSFSLGGDRWGYNLYTFTPTTNTATLGEGARLWYQLSDIVTVGLSGQIGEQLHHTFRSQGADVDFKVGRYGLTAEYAESVISGSGPESPKSYYTSPYVEFYGGKFLIYGIADYLDNPSSVTQGGAYAADPYKRWDFGAGVNWLPLSNTRFRLGYTSSQYQGTDTVIDPNDRDYYTVDLSVVVAF